MSAKYKHTGAEDLVIMGSPAPLLPSSGCLPVLCLSYTSFYCSHWASQAPQNYCSYKPTQRCTKCQTPAPWADTWQSPAQFYGRISLLQGPGNNSSSCCYTLQLFLDIFINRLKGSSMQLLGDRHTPCYQTSFPHLSTVSWQEQRSHYYWMTL